MEVDEQQQNYLNWKMTVQLENILRLSFVYLLLTSMARLLVALALYAVAVPKIQGKIHAVKYIRYLILRLLYEMYHESNEPLDCILLFIMFLF